MTLPARPRWRAPTPQGGTSGELARALSAASRALEGARASLSDQIRGKAGDEVSAQFWGEVSTQRHILSAVHLNDPLNLARYESVALGVNLSLRLSERETQLLISTLNRRLRDAGWIGFKARAQERWIPLSSARALLPQRRASRIPSPSPSITYYVKLALWGTQHELSELCAQVLRLTERSSTSQSLPSVLSSSLSSLTVQAVEGHKASHKVSHQAGHEACHEARFTLIDLMGVDAHLIIWARDHPYIDLVEVYPVTDREVDEANSEWRGSADLWCDALPPPSWCVQARRDTQQLAKQPTPKPAQREALISSRASSTIISHLEVGLEGSHVSTANSAPLLPALLIFSFSLASTLRAQLSALPTPLQRRVGVTIISGDEHELTSDLIILRLINLKRLTRAELDLLYEHIPIHESLDQLILSSSQPLIYRSSMVKLTPELTSHELAQLTHRAYGAHSALSAHTDHINAPNVESHQRQASGLLPRGLGDSRDSGDQRDQRDHVAHRALTLCASVRFEDELWRRGDLQLIEVSPWREHRGDELELALSPRRQANLERWLSEATLTLSTQPHTQPRFKA